MGTRFIKISLICLNIIVSYLTDPGEYQFELDEASLQPLTVFRVASGYSYTLSSCCDGWVLDKHGGVLVLRAGGMSAVLVITEREL